MFVGNNDLVGKWAPELVRVGPWVNAAPLRLRYDLADHPVLVTFFTSTDLNSVRALPVLTAWHKQYGQYGLAIIGVHMPDFSFEQSMHNIAAFLAAYGVTFPVVLDNQGVASQAFSCEYRPSFYLVDRQRIVRYVQSGEGEYFALERLIRELLREANISPTEPPLVGPEDARIRCFHPTPRLYCGHARGHIGNAPGEAEGQVAMYVDSGDYEQEHIYLQGLWLQEQECVRHARQTASPVDYLAVRYHAHDVQAVMGSADGQPVKVLVRQDGARLPLAVAGRDVDMVDGEGWVTVTEPRLYALITDIGFSSHIVRLSSDSDGFDVYALAFCGSLQRTDLDVRAWLSQQDDRQLGPSSLE